MNTDKKVDIVLAIIFLFLMGAVFLLFGHWQQAHIVVISSAIGIFVGRVLVEIATAKAEKEGSNGRT